MRTIDIHEAKANRVRRVKQAGRARSFLIAAGTPRVVAIPLDAPEVAWTRRLGFLEAAVCVPEDFDRMGRAKIVRLFGAP